MFVYWMTDSDDVLYFFMCFYVQDLSVSCDMSV